MAAANALTLTAFENGEAHGNERGGMFNAKL